MRATPKDLVKIGIYTASLVPVIYRFFPRWWNRCSLGKGNAAGHAQEPVSVDGERERERGGGRKREAETKGRYREKKRERETERATGRERKKEHCQFLFGAHASISCKKRARPTLPLP
jgi:hypothetical protein